MIIGDTSALRRIPLNLERKRALFLDSIRFSVEMADLSFSRLYSSLAHLTNETTPGMAPGIFMDAWAVVDSIHRLSLLVSHTPGLKKRQPAVQTFLRGATEAEELRHIVQHLNKHLQQPTDEIWPAWGRISWFTLTDKPNEGQVCVLVSGSLNSGTLMKGTPNDYIPNSERVRVPVDHIRLQCGPHAVLLSKQIDRIEALARQIEQDLDHEFGDSSSLGSDLLVRTIWRSKEE